MSKVHGIRGELRVAFHWAHSDALEQAREVLLRRDGQARRFEIEQVRDTPKGAIVALVGVDDRNAAEALKGATVWVERSQLPPLEQGEYYLADLVGARVTGPDGDVGQVVRVATHPSVDSLVIETPSGQIVEQPLLDHWLDEVDVARAIVSLKSTEGLIGD